MKSQPKHRNESDTSRQERTACPACGAHDRDHTFMECLQWHPESLELSPIDEFFRYFSIYEFNPDELHPEDALYLAKTIKRTLKKLARKHGVR